nr:C39 family peptidase [Bacillus mycoides]
MSQNPELERGCEVTSLAMLLQFNGLSVDKLELAKNIKYVPFQNNGLMGNMDEGFVGNIYDIDIPGLGVHIKPIIELAKLYVSENSIIDLTGSNPENLYKEIDKGHPVWILTNGSFRKLPDYEFRTWQTNKGETQVTYRQHSVLLTGYNDQYVFINDPLDMEKNKRIDKQDFEEAWVQLGRQALTIIP